MRNKLFRIVALALLGGLLSVPSIGSLSSNVKAGNKTSAVASQELPSTFSSDGCKSENFVVNGISFGRNNFGKADSHLRIKAGSYFEKVTSISNLNEGDQILLCSKKNSTMYMNSTFNSSNYLNVTSMVVNTDTFSVSDFSTIKPFTLGKSNGNWLFYFEDNSTLKLPANTSKNNNLYKTTKLDSTSEWTITFDTNKSAIITSVAKDTYSLKFNFSGAARISNYLTTNTTMVFPELYRLAGVTESIDISENEKTIFEDQTASLSLLKYSGITPSSYAWEITEGTDVISFVGDTNKSTVIIKGLKAGTATVKLTVNDAVFDTSVITVKSINEAIIKPGTYFITDSAKSHLMTKTLDDSTTIDLVNMDNAFTFEFADKGLNSYYIRSSLGYLIKGSTNSALALSNYKDLYFTISGDSANGYLLVPSTSSSSSLKVGTNGKWLVGSGTNKVFLYEQQIFDSIVYEGTLTKSTYNAGDEFNPLGLSFFIKYQGSLEQYALTKTITWNKIEANKTSVTGTVNVCGENKTVTVTDLTITNYLPDRLTLTGTYKTEYYVGEKVDLTGLIVTLTLVDGANSKESILNANEYNYSPKYIEANTSKITISLPNDSTINASFDISLLTKKYVVSNYVTSGEKIVIASMSANAYGITGGVELDFNNESPTVADFSYTPSGLHEFLVEDTSYFETVEGVTQKAYALKNTVTGKYLELDGNKFGYPNRSKITATKDNDTYSFNYVTKIDGSQFTFKFTGGTLKQDGSVTGFSSSGSFSGYQDDYIVGSCDLSNDGTGLITYEYYKEANNWQPITDTINVEWELDNVPVIYTSALDNSINTSRAFFFDYDKDDATWAMRPYCNSGKYITYNPDGDFGVYNQGYNSITIYRNNSVSLPRHVNSITIDTTGVKTEYEIGDQFEWTGLEVTAHYDGGINSKLPVGGYEISSPDMNSVGSKTVTVSYGTSENTVSQTYTITVSGGQAEIPTVVSYEITTQPTTIYEQGDTVTFDGVITAHMSDGSDVILTSDDYTISHSGTTTVGSKTVTINIKNSGGKYLQYIITVIAKKPEVNSLTLSGMTTEYNVGDEFSFDGKAYVHYSDGTSKKVTPTNISEVSTLTAGTFTVTISYTEENKTVNATYSITVIQHTTSVSLDKENATLTIGENTTLVATVNPGDASNKSVIWSSSNNNVATVDQNGTVTAVGVGTATITVTTNDGSLTSTCTITVNPISVTGVTLNETSLNLEEGNNATLFATVTPTNATNTGVTFSSSNESVATVDQNGKVTAISEGNATITVTTSDGSFTATCEVIVTAKNNEETPVNPVTPSDNNDSDKGCGGSLVASSISVSVLAASALGLLISKRKEDK